MGNKKTIRAARALYRNGWPKDQIAMRLGIRRRELNRIMNGKWRTKKDKSEGA